MRKSSNNELYLSASLTMKLTAAMRSPASLRTMLATRFASTAILLLPSPTLLRAFHAELLNKAPPRPLAATNANCLNTPTVALPVSASTSAHCICSPSAFDHEFNP